MDALGGDVEQNLAAAEAAVGVTDPSLSLNITGIADWSPNMPFLDLMKVSRPMSGHTEETWGAVSFEDLGADGVLDDHGYPTYIPDELEAIGTIFAWSDPNNIEYRKGVYVFEYEGEGTVEIGGAGLKILSREPGKIVFENTLGKTFGINISDTDPNGTGDYLRDFSLVREEHLELYQAGAMFNPDWLPLVEDVRQVRLMDWLETNNSTLTDWDSRAKLDDASWAAHGVPVEVAVRLANELGTDAWFTVPHNATDEYIREFATYVRDNLDPRLTVSAEFSNEIWNYGFQQTKDILTQVNEDWGNGDVVGYGLKLQTEAAMIWDEVFANEPEGRLQKVLGGQAFNSFNTEQLMDARGWFAKEPDNAVRPSEVFDALAITTYFGHNTTVDDDLEAELLAAIEDPNVDAMAYLEEKLLDPDYSFSIPFIVEKLSVQKQMAEANGLDFIAYEGGQHVHHKGAGVLGEFLLEFNRSEHMANLYQALWDAWEVLGDGPFMQFGEVGLANTFASFAMLQSLDDSTPRADLLYELNETVPAWWETGREEGTFQQGVILEGDGGNNVLIGTREEDYLLGGSGDDVFAAGRGNDGIHGGAGRDIVQVNGTYAEYSVEPAENGYWLIGPDGVDLLVDVEEVMFSDGTFARLDGFTIIEDPEALPVPDTEPVPEPEDTPPPAPDPDPAPGGGSDPAPAPTPDPVDVDELRGQLIDGTDNTDTLAAGIQLNGIRVTAVSDASLLAQEIGTTEGAYVVTDKRATAEFGGEILDASFDATQQNLGPEGQQLAASALEAALAFGTVTRGIEIIEGTSKNDMFIGGDGADEFIGGFGNDVMLGRDGNDTLRGGDGDDLLIGEGGNDVIDGGAGIDTAAFSGTASDYQLVAENGGVRVYQISGIDDTDLLIDIEKVRFDDGNVLDIEELLEPAPPVPSGGPVVNDEHQLHDMPLDGVLRIEGFEASGAVIDAINPYSLLGQELELTRDDSIYGFTVVEINKTLEFDGTAVKANYWSVQDNKAASKDGAVLGASALDVALEYGSVVKAAAAVVGSDGDDRIYGRQADDRFEGGLGDDLLLGRQGRDQLNGGEGDDRLSGGVGDDILTGGVGSDMFVFSLGGGIDLITDLEAEDTLDFRALAFESMDEVFSNVSGMADGHMFINFGGGEGVVIADASPQMLDSVAILI